MVKNEIIELDIVDMSESGSGIGKYNGMAVFVSGATVGDKITAKVLKVKKNYAFAKIEKINEPSKDRIESDCPVSSKCGGCAYRHITYESECEIKEKRVYDCMKRIGGIDVKPQPIVKSDKVLRYRNKAQYPISEDGQLGFYGNHSHRVIPCDDCLLQPFEFSLAAKVMREFISKTHVTVYNEETGKGILRHLYLRKSAQNGEVLILPVINGETLPNSNILIDMLKDTFGDKLSGIVLNVNKEDTNVVLGDKNIILYGKDTLCDELCGVSVTLSPHSFYQVNRDTADLLYKIAGRYADVKDKTVIDLYCGAGTIGLSLAKDARRVIGVEVVPQAIENAKLNAKNSALKNTEFICADALCAANTLQEQGVKPDVVIVDPPRKGCDKRLIEIIANSFAPSRVVYVSCDPSTLARDVKVFCDCGYILKEYTPVDMFPRTPHVETVALLTEKV